MGLFLTTNENHQHHHNTTVEKTVKVERAPTDKSVELLAEMQRKAVESIFAKVSLNSNILKSKAIFMMDPIMFQSMVKIMYELNGIRHIVDITIDSFELDTKDKIQAHIWNKLSSDIATHLILGMDKESMAALDEAVGKVRR